MFNLDQKRILSLDGGGIMGMITLQFLKRMEDQLRPHSGRGDAFRLCDFFDYIGGTSTGAIIASGLAIGKSVDDLIDFYGSAGRDMFQKAPFYRRFFYSYDSSPLQKKLKDIIGERSVLEMHERGDLKSLLCVVMRNASTDSPWPITTNPNAIYNNPDSIDCNMKLPLWQLVRASTAAPTYFQPETIQVGSRNHQFIDGGVTPYNNPAFLMYKLATLPQYRLDWPQGESRMMLVSVGTGLAYAPLLGADVHGRGLLKIALSITGEVMRGIQVENDVNCRTVGRCVHGAVVDGELGDMKPAEPLSQDLGRRFLYARYDADVSRDGLEALGLGNVDPASLQMDAAEEIPTFKRIGAAAAANQVDIPRDFATFMPAAPVTAV